SEVGRINGYGEQAEEQSARSAVPTTVTRGRPVRFVVVSSFFFSFSVCILLFLAKHHTPQFSLFSACTLCCPVPYSMYHSHSFFAVMCTSKAELPSCRTHACLPCAMAAPKGVCCVRFLPG
ncbi:unnamed protein product, partial [Ectocarpus sp. 12 AP-2014]